MDFCIFWDFGRIELKKKIFCYFFEFEAEILYFFMFWSYFCMNKRCILLLFLDYWLNKYNNKARKINIKHKKLPIKTHKTLFLSLSLYVIYIFLKRKKTRKRKKENSLFFLSLSMYIFILKKKEKAHATTKAT
jgi:hypothetical protein